MTKSLRVQLVFWSVALEAVLLVTLGVALVLILRTVQQRSSDESLHLAAAQLNASVDVRGDAFSTPAEDVAALQAAGIFAWILTPAGQVAGTVGIAATNAVPAPLPATGQMLSLELPNEEPIRIFATPLQEGSKVLGMLVLGLPLREAQRLQQRFIYALLFLIPAVLALSAFGGLFLANRALAPVTEITRMAQQVSAEELSGRLNLDLPDDEIGQLARTFDAMLARLEDAFRREQQLTADVSHELRTPLSLLKAQLSLARSKPRDAATLLAMMTDMESDVDRLTRIVEQTLLLTQIEQQGIAAPVPVQLDDILRGVMERVGKSATNRNVRLVLDLPPQMEWQLPGDGSLLAQAFDNLLQNALAYTPAQGTVTLRARRHWQELVVTVEDSGAGIAAEHLPHLFERYYRVDSARARSSGGFGLGLAIVQTIVRAHGGGISVESVVGSGSIFTVTLPAFTN